MGELPVFLTRYACLLALATAALTAADSRPEAVASYGRLPLRFEPNQGQAAEPLRYLARGAGYRIGIDASGAEIVLLKDKRQSRVRLTLEGAAPGIALEHADLQPGKTSYFVGNRSRWRTGIAGYGRVTAREVYPGVDMVYYGNQQRLEFDFQVAAGADPSRIRLGVSGQRGLRVDGNGDLMIETAEGTLRQLKPVVYQQIAGKRVERSGAYQLDGGVVRFALGPYDRSEALIIDPVLSYSTYLGGSFGDAAFGLAVDGSGAAYVTGQTASGEFPSGAPSPVVTPGPQRGPSDAFLTKLSASGSSLVYSVVIGGAGEDVGVAVAVDATGAAYLAGHTTSTDFPVLNLSTPFAGNRDAFLLKMNAAGDALTFSTYLGGSGEDRALGVAVAAADDVYIAGTTGSPNFPTNNAISASFNGGPRDAFAARFNTAGTGAATFSTLLGGGGDEAALGVAADATGVYVSGFTTSVNYPTLNPIRAANAGGADAFLTKLAPGGTLIYSTYLGGSGDDRSEGVAIDSTGAAYIAGWSFSTNYPTVAAYRTTTAGAYEGFVSKVNPAGSALVYSTYLGGNGEDYISSIVVDSTNAAIVAGYTSSSNFPTLATSPGYANGRTDGAFVTRFTPAGNAIDFSTYLGGAGTDQANGLAVDPVRAIYVAGSTISAEFPVIGAYQATAPGGGDAFVSKFIEGTPLTYSVTTNPGGLNVTVNGQTLVAPRFFGWTPGSTQTIGAPSPQGGGPTRYTFTGWSQGGSQTQTITVPSASTTYAANFNTQHQLTLLAQPSGAGGVTVSNPSADGYYGAGTVVQVSATPGNGYAFAGFTGDLSGTAATQSLTMSQPRSVTALFSCTYALSGNSVTVDGGANTGSFNLTTGAACPVSISASADWITITGGLGGPGSRTVSYSVSPNLTTNNRTAAINVSDGVSNFPFTITQGPQPPGSITINTNPTGLQFTIDGATFTAPRTFQFQAGTSHVVSALSPQTVSGTRSSFASWSNGGGQTQTVVAPTVGVLSLTATYTIAHQLSAIVTPAGSGVITLSPPSADGFYAPGTVVSVSASSNVGATFVGFSGAISGTASPQQVTMSGPRTVLATFTPVTCGTDYSLSPQTLAVPETGGQFAVTVNTAGGCFWSAAISPAFIDPWVTLTGVTAATGTGSFGLTIPANNNPFPRTASINVQGNLVQVVQKGANVPVVFNDVPLLHPFFDFIALINRFGTSPGCGSNNYCPDSIVTRAQMAELIIRSRFGEDFPFPSAPFFTDVPQTHPQFKYIQRMRELGITVGCTATTYCPGNPVTRGEMSVFLVRTRLGVLLPEQFTFRSTPYFTDVPANNIFFAYIQKMKELGITAGCSATEFCSTAGNTQGQMSVFLIRSFNTP